MQLNSLNTELSDEFLSKFPKEVSIEILDYINSISFIRNLTSVSRKKISECKKQDDGKIIVDLTNPHILENMDFFRERAIYFGKHGRYTNITPNTHAQSEYRAFWKEEKRRWKEGLVREDGEWITGYHYFYLNYCPIWKVVGEGPKADRVFGLPECWLGDYLWFHYVDQAESKGEHCKLLKARSRGFSFKLAGMGVRNMYTYPGQHNFYLASEKTYLEGDGVFSKVRDVLDHIAVHTPLKKMRSIDQQLYVRLGYHDEYGVEQGLKSTVKGISLKDSPNKARGIRGKLVDYEEDGVFPDIEDAWNVNLSAVGFGESTFGTMISGGCVCAGTKVWNKDGVVLNIEDLTQSDGILGFNVDEEISRMQSISWMQPPLKKDCVEISTKYRSLNCSKDHPVLVRKRNIVKTKEIVGTRTDFNKKYNKTYVNNRFKSIFIYTKEWKKAGDIKVGDVVLCLDKLDFWGNETLFDARLVGMLIGDGSYGMRRHYNRIEFKTPSFSNCDKEILQYVESRYKCNIEVSRLTKDCRLYKELSISNLIPRLKEIGIAGQSKDRKRLPINYMNLTKSDSCLLLAGLYDTDGYVSVTKNSPDKIQITQSSYDILVQIKFLLEKLGIISVISKTEPRICKTRKDKNPYYTLSIGDENSMLIFRKEIPLIVEYKKENLNKIFERINNKDSVRKYNTFKNIREERVYSVKDIGVKDIYNLTAKEDNTYIANGIITHNTGGTIGANFEGSEKMFRSPSSYKIYGIPNVFDKNSDNGSLVGFFWGEYLNRKGCYDSNGEPDVSKALSQVLLRRHDIKYNSRDSRALTQRKAEECLTPMDAIMRVDGTIYPVADLRDYLEEIMPNRSILESNHYVGKLDIKGGTVSWSPSADVYPIKKYPCLDANTEGAVVIYEMPKPNAKRGRYISGLDPYDDDQGTSLGSIIVIDTITKRIVAEYTGRPKFANDFYETCRRLILFFDAECNYENNKKGVFTYFSNMYSLHLLCRTPSTLRDVDVVKGELYGNKAVGTNATREVNAYARRLTRDWLLSPAYQEQVRYNEEYDKDGNTKGNAVVKMNLQTIPSIPLVEELIAWNPDGNFDRHAALGMCMILLEDKLKYISSSLSGDTKDTKDFASSEFFNMNTKGYSKTIF